VKLRNKVFAGARVRALRRAQGLRLEDCALKLGISASYLSQIETNQRPVTARVLMALLDLFGIAASEFEAEREQLLLADLREAAVETGSGATPVPLSELRVAATQTPNLARRFLDLHRANRRLAERMLMVDEAVALNEGAGVAPLLPYEEVRDYFHFKDNYIDSLDAAAEGLASQVFADAATPFEGLKRHLEDNLHVEVAVRPSAGLLRSFDRGARRLSIDAGQSPSTQAFQLAFQIVAIAFSDLIEGELSQANFRCREAMDVCRVGLGNYAAGALLMPYGRFALAAGQVRHDGAVLAAQFGASLEQVFHRLSTLQRPTARGVPIYFVRLDGAGNITKRHSATRFRFARFGGACPLWNVHDASASTDRFFVQLAEMPDGVKYLCVAHAILKPASAYPAPGRRYVLGFGCEIEHARELVYSDSVDLKGPTQPIGVSCRICERQDCQQRAFPPVDRTLVVPRDERWTVPFRVSARE
jgi:predicted transcriptional regulator